MQTSETTQLVYFLLVLMLVASSLLAYRLPLGKTLKMALAWLCIFGAGFVLMTFRPAFQDIWQRLKGEFSGQAEVTAEGSYRIRISEDGHFYVDGQVNGRSVRFLIDSGASTTTMTLADARSSGVEIDETGSPVIVSTANGMTLERRGRIGNLVIGPVSRADFAIHVSETLGETNLLGMNWLSSLQGWRVEGDEMVLNP